MQPLLQWATLLSINRFFNMRSPPLVAVISNEFCAKNAPFRPHNIGIPGVFLIVT